MEGIYTLNEGQHVNAADAESLAAALELVLPDPDTDSDAAIVNDPFVDVRFPGPNDKAGLKELIAFCREGLLLSGQHATTQASIGLITVPETSVKR